MEIKQLNERRDIEKSARLKKRYLKFEKLINELKRNKIPKGIIGDVNNHIDDINAISDNSLGKQIRRSQSNILKLIEKELQLVVKNHYRNRYLALGMTLGLAIGSSISSGTGNSSLVSLGMVLGMAIGIAMGTTKDKKAKDEGKQLDLEI